MAISMEKGFSIVELKPQDALAIKEEVANPEIPRRMGEIFGELMAFIQRNRVQAAGPPFALYHSWNDAKTVMEVGFPIASPVKGDGRVQPLVLPGGRVVNGSHVGPYDRLQETYGAMMKWMAEKGVKPAARMWEVYMTDPQKEKDPSKFVTQLFWPIEQ